MKTACLAAVITSLALMLGSCGSSRHTIRGDRGIRQARTTEIISVRAGRHTVEPIPADTGACRLIAEARGWIGTPYRYGGNDRGGVDCSGFTCAVYESATGIKLPRSSREQCEWCKGLKRSDLRPGDLVFFTSRRGGDRVNHVAIFIGDGAIIHATTSQGVVESSLDEDYWDSHYFSGGRVHGMNP